MQKLVSWRGKDMPNGTEIRRAYVDARGKLYEDWRFTSKIDFADNGGNRSPNV